MTRDKIFHCILGDRIEEKDGLVSSTETRSFSRGKQRRTCRDFKWECLIVHLGEVFSIVIFSRYC
jgi:hypothetical protein